MLLLCFFLDFSGSNLKTCAVTCLLFTPLPNPPFSFFFRLPLLDFLQSPISSLWENLSCWIKLDKVSLRYNREKLENREREEKKEWDTKAFFRKSEKPHLEWAIGTQLSTATKKKKNPSSAYFGIFCYLVLFLACCKCCLLISLTS